MSTLTTHSSQLHITEISPPSSTTLPLEVCEEIIDLCSDVLWHEALKLDTLPRGDYSDVTQRVSSRYRTLRACALTCRSWLPRSRFNLFRSVYLTDATRLTRLLSSLRAHPESGSLVHFLQLTGFDREDSESPENPWLHLIPLQLLPMLKKVQVLELLRPSMSIVTPSFSTAFSHSNSLVDLTLRDLRFKSFVHLVQFLTNFPNLTHLSLHYVWGTEDQYHPHLLAKLRSSKIRLSSLSILCSPGGGGGVVNMINWLLLTASIPSLTSLQFNVPSWSIDETRSLGTLLSVCGPSVRRVIIEGAMPAENLSLLHLEHNTNLRILHLPLINQNGIPALATLFSSLDCHHLEEILLCILVIGQADLTANYWKQLDVAISHPRFSTLKSVICRFWFLHGTIRSSIDLLDANAVLPQLRSRGILYNGRALGL